MECGHDDVLIVHSDDGHDLNNLSYLLDCVAINLYLS